MVSVIKEFSYKTPGRGRGILGLRDFKPCRRPGAAGRAEERTERAGETAVEGAPTSNSKDTRLPEVGVVYIPNSGPNPTHELSTKLVVALFDYSANPNAPGGFAELSLRKGQMLELVAEHPDNEHWWEVRNEDGETGFVPASYVLIKEEQALPWLQLSALQSEEEERKHRAKRLTLQQEAEKGRGFGPPPKLAASNLPPKPYVSAYNRTTQQANKMEYYCEVCDKHLNGPKPYQAHLGSKAHKEELALRDN